MNSKKPNYQIYDDNEKTEDPFTVFVWVSIAGLSVLAIYVFLGGILGV